MRTNGILLSISSLPSKHGVGDFGKNAYKFVDYLKKTKIKIWQMLPLNPLGYGNSPYQSECSEAIDPLFISLDKLKEEGYLKSVKTFNASNDRVDYEEVRKFKEAYLRKAFAGQKDTKTKEFKQFLENSKWIDNYTKFHIIFLKNNYLPWNDWDEKERLDPYNHKVNYNKYKEEILFLKWCQFIAFKQYFALRKYANDNGILIMGDIPFYVGGMSSDVWENQDDFLLDEHDQFTHIAGVPPDYFSTTGQRWGNPIYDWKVLKEDKYDFWLNRIRESAKLYDILRIDHFRAFDTYWKVPSSCPTAIEGSWEIGPGSDFFDTLNKAKLKIKIIAEDLGDLFPSVLELRDKYNLPGMFVLEFNFLDPNQVIKQNQIVYTGTHDNDTLVGWFNSLSNDEQNRVNNRFNELGVKGETLNEKFLNYAYNSVADYVIIPMQDFLGKDTYFRMNVPGTCRRPNWEYKMVDFKEFVSVLPRIKKLIESSGR